MTESQKKINPLKQMLFNLHGTCYMRDTQQWQKEMSSKAFTQKLLRDNMNDVYGIRGMKKKRDYYYMYYPYRSRLAHTMSPGHELRQLKKDQVRYHNRRQIDFMCRFLLASRKKVSPRY